MSPASPPFVSCGTHSAASLPLVSGPEKRQSLGAGVPWGSPGSLCPPRVPISEDGSLRCQCHVRASQQLHFKELLQSRQLRFRAETGMVAVGNPAHGVPEPLVLLCGEQICNPCLQTSKKTSRRVVGRSLFAITPHCGDARGAEQVPGNRVWRLTLKSPRVKSCPGLCRAVWHPLR